MSPPPDARWVDHIIVRADSTEEEDHVRKQFNGPLPDCYNTSAFELRKTGFEIQAIREIAAFMDILCSTVELPPRGITANRVHILKPNDFKLALGENRDAVTILGHSYITRAPDKTVQMFLLTHELAHLASYLSLISIGGSNRNHVTWHRSGYAVQTRRRGRAFTGLNEAAAEIIAGLVRKMLARKSDLLDKSAKKELTSGYVYASAVRVVQEMARLIAEHENMDESAALMSVIDDFLTGRHTFLYLANQAIPRSTAILRAMSPEPHAALTAARALGLDEVVDDIREYMNGLYELEF